MHTFLLDLWHDLRAKRLAPVAALLLVAIAAVPFVLVQKADPAPPPVTPPTQATTASDKLPTIQLDEISSKSPSRLNQFTQRNPFRPLRDIPKKAAGSGEKQTVDLGASPKSDGSSGSGGGASASSASSDSSSGGSSGSTGGSTGSSGGSSSGGSRTIYYDYRTDIKFGLSGKAKAMKQVAAFTLLGDQDEPAAMFMGVTDDHKWAVFTVDTARYEAQGEHECKPTPDRCEFIYLKTGDEGNETTLTTLDGSKSYDLTLTAIKRIVLDKADVENVPTENKSDAAASKSRKTVDPEPRSWFDILAKKF